MRTLSTMVMPMTVATESTLVLPTQTVTLSTTMQPRATPSTITTLLTTICWLLTSGNWTRILWIGKVQVEEEEESVEVVNARTRLMERGRETDHPKQGKVFELFTQCGWNAKRGAIASG
uniref:Uncharacterized protein n=1 Tax=Cacopsylla melanoneura TaxID=428564 RepID=A0A8D8R1J9_9HEMI